MFWCTRTLRFTLHSPRGVGFTLSSSEATAAVQKKYSKRWFGVHLDSLILNSANKEFLPFYLCRGHINATFTATVSYPRITVDSSGNSRSSTQYVHTQPIELNSVFSENSTQFYAGYKYNINFVHYALKDEETPIRMQKLNTIDTDGATINLFEQSTETLKEFLKQEVGQQARRTAESMVRQFHQGAASININFTNYAFRVEEITPVFVPCYIIKADHDGQHYTLYVNGASGRVGGPYLLNELYIARTTAVATVLGVTLFCPNKVAGLVYGLVASIAIYYAAFYAAKYFPSYRRDYLRSQRQRMQKNNQGNDGRGFFPSARSQRITEEYHSSSYWDNHAYEKKSSGGRTSSASSSSSGRTSVIRDPKGYYAVLELKGDESVNEVRSAYRRVVLKQHPDVGGSTELMRKVNEAYRVLRDPKRRAEYDLL